MTVRLAKSTNTGMTWPTLSGTAGDLTTLMDALLVNGSNTISISSITRSGTTATVNTAVAHGISSVSTTPASERRVLHAGLDQAEYNGEFTATYVDSDTYTIEVSGSPATPATGTGLARRPPCGWATAFTAANKRSYRAATGNRHYCRIVDDGTTSAAYGRIVGYETMSDVDTGTALFPTAAQVSGGLWIHKSSTANATTRPWCFIGDEVRWYLFVDYDSNATPFGAALATFFGEIVSYKSGDAYHTMAIGSASATPANSNNVNHVKAPSATSATEGNYIVRGHAQTGTSLNVLKLGQITTVATNVATSGGSAQPLTYPSPASGGLYTARMVIADTTAVLRGEVPGCWTIYHNRPATNYDTWSGVGANAGRTFMQVNTGGNSVTASAGCVALEVSDTW